MESTLIRETINQSNNININIKDDKNHSSNFEYTPKSVVHNWSEIRKSGQDGARTATVYVTAVFDSQYVNGVEYVKPDQVRFSIFMHDNTFRPVYVDGVAVNDGYGAVDRYGNLMGGYVREFLPTRVNYPTPGYSYGGSTNFSYYLNNQSFNMIGGSAEFTIERGSTGGSVTRIKVDAFY